jgi:RecB family exonuclease
MANKGPQGRLDATGAGLRLGDYALGSPQSRAAARALLERRFAERRRIDIVCSIPRPGAERGIQIGTWREGADGSLIRLSNLPPGMTIEEAERIVAQRGQQQTH